METQMEKENISTTMAVIVSFLAASCCIGPAIFIVFGVSAGFMGNFGFGVILFIFALSFKKF